MIGKIILGIFILVNCYLYIKKWNTKNPIKTIGLQMLLVDLFDLAIISLAFLLW